MPASGRESYIACISSKSSSFEATGRVSRAKRRPIESHMRSIGDNPRNKQGKEEVARVGLNKSLEQSLQRVGVYYLAEE
ncbi:hypothetical protein TNCV_2237731 [Trichonephila clavipes]|nr:hypothetical protein TNCV_2237731 [Trichonephila clavipes]